MKQQKLTKKSIYAMKENEVNERHLIFDFF
jgi:hypothetical protein